MNHDRVAMLAALNLVKPAIATKDLIEELVHVWFDGTTITAYNDADLGIQVPFESPFKGGIRGALLLGLLHNSRAKEVIFEKTEEGLILKAARAKVNVAVLDSARVVYEVPAPSENTIEFDDGFIDALKRVMIAVGNDTAMPEKMGVTFIVDGKKVSLFTTDAKTIATVANALTLKEKIKESRFIVPTVFCEQLIRLCSAGGVLDLQKDSVSAQNADGVFLWGRLVESSNRPFDFYDALERHTKFPKGAVFELPSRLSLALERALTILDDKPGEPATFTIDSENGKLRIYVAAEGRGELKDSVDIPDGVPAASFKVPPGIIKRAFALSKEIAANDKTLYMRDGEGFEYIATTSA